jgi:hypothetical protein
MCILDFSEKSKSKFYFDLSDHNIQYARFRSWKGRWLAFHHLLVMVVQLPLALIYKLGTTAGRVALFFVSLASFVLSLGLSTSARRVLVGRWMAASGDFIDWILFPFAVALYAIRLILGACVHPFFVFGLH